MADGTTRTGSFKQKQQAIESWIAELSRAVPDATLDICIETSTGPLINALIEYPQVRIFPLNPLALANYRKAFAPGGGKNDPVDAKLIMQFVLHYYPTLQQAQKAGKTTLRKLFYGKGTKEKIETRLQLIMDAKPLSSDPVLLRTAARQCQIIARQLQLLNESIKDYDAQLKLLVKLHVDYKIVSKLPGASFRTYARLIAALGDDLLDSPTPNVSKPLRVSLQSPHKAASQNSFLPAGPPQSSSDKHSTNMPVCPSENATGLRLITTLKSPKGSHRIPPNVRLPLSGYESFFDCGNRACPTAMNTI